MRCGLLLVALALVTTNSGGFAQEVAVPEPQLRFAPERVEIHWTRDGWCLKAGDVLLKDFGRRNTDAADALRLIRDLGLSERGVIGSPAPVLEYWLANGQPPTGNLRGHRMIPIDRQTLRTEGDGGQWCVRDADRVLFNFGYAKDQAEQAVALIHKHRFARLLLLGQGAPTMMVFLRDPGEASLPQRHNLASLTMRATPIKVSTLKPVDEKKLAASKELAGIQNYATPTVPPLRDTTQANPAAGSPMLTVPGVTDRLNRIPFDWRQAQVRRDPDGWVLHVGSLVLARFGPEEVTARRGLQAIHHYRFNEICMVGAPRPTFSFFTVNGQLPRGEMFGVTSQPVLTEQLKMQLTDGRQTIVQGTEVVLTLGDRPEDARQMLDWLQRHKADRICRIASHDGSGVYFFTQR